MSEVDDLVKEWNELGEEYKSLEVIKVPQNSPEKKIPDETEPFPIIFLSPHNTSFQSINQTYLELLDEFEDLQSKCTKEIAHQRYRIAQLVKGLKWVSKLMLNETMSTLNHMQWSSASTQLSMMECA